MSNNKQVAGDFLAALGRGDVETMKSLLTPQSVAICTGTGLLSGTRDYAAICETASGLGRITRAGIRFTIVSMTAEEDRVSCEARGESVLVNGVPYNNEYHFLFTVRDGKVVRMVEYMDSKLTEQVLGPLLAG